MGKFRRGSQLGDPTRNAEREERKRQIKRRNKAQKRQALKATSKKVMIVLLVVMFSILLFERHLIRYDEIKVSDRYRDTVNSYFGENPLRQSKLIFSAEGLNEAIAAAHPEVDMVNIGIPLWGPITLDFEAKDPSFYWQTGDVRYIGDQNGILFSEASQFQDELPLFQDRAALQAQEGDQVVSSQALEYIERLEDELKKANITPSYYRIPEQARQIDMFINGKEYFIKISLDRNVAGQVDELKKVLKFINASGTQVNNYIDLRTIDKAFYR